MSDAPTFLPMASPEAGSPVFERIAVVGLGLIGGSIALAARERWPSGLVIGVDRGPMLERAIARHAVDVAAEDLMIASEAELVILAAPVRANLDLLAALPRYVQREAIVTDVGSTKRAIVEAAANLPPRLRFVGGHPLAGAARAGIEFARPDLFAERPWLITPGAEVPAGDLARLTAFIEGIGAHPSVIRSAAAHDHLVAFLSHLPQLTASALMKAIGDGAGEEALGLAGRGLIDTTRLASSPAAIWRDICATNGDEIGAALDILIATLTDLRRGLASAEVVDSVFEPAAAWRERLVRATGGTA